VTDSEAKAVIEAALLAADKPLTVEQLRAAVEELTPSQILALVAQLRDECLALGRGIRVVEVASGYQLVTDPAWAERLGRIYRKVRAARLSRPSLETLAIMAYRQPITRIEIEEIRGVDVSGVIQSLMERNLVKMVGRKEGVGRPILYGTTQEFLERFGLKSLEALPPLAEFKEPEPELQPDPQTPQESSPVEPSHSTPTTD